MTPLLVYECQICEQEFRVPATSGKLTPGVYDVPKLGMQVAFHGSVQQKFCFDAVCEPCGIRIGRTLEITIEKLRTGERV